MTDRALFGTSDEPAHLDGYGPIPAELAREIVAGACTRGERVWLRRLYTHPTTGELAAMDARGRLFRGSLGRFIQLRDRVCRTPGAMPRPGTPTTPVSTRTAVGGAGVDAWRRVSRPGQSCTSPMPCSEAPPATW
jgi:hypothetical protein